MTRSLLLEHFDDLLVTPENAEQLNYTILGLATQGKLVEQDSTDQPVSKALQEIDDPDEMKSYTIYQNRGNGSIFISVSRFWMGNVSL
jgi:hypothetical protein